MVSAKDCLAKYGNPEREVNMMVYRPSDVLRASISVLPDKIYCNKDLAGKLDAALHNVAERDLGNEVLSWNGCFNIRKKRGQNTASLHSWGMAIDINAATNAFGANPTMSAELVACFTNAGFDWGGHWSKPDGMHFQPKSL